MKSQFLISWKGKGTHEDPYVPDLPEGIIRFVDATNADHSNGIPTKNFFVAELDAPEEVLDSLRASGKSELWREGNEEDEPTTEEKTFLRAKLSSQLGLTVEEMNGLHPNKTTRKESAERLAEICKTLK